MTGQRYSSRKRRPRDTAATEINVGSANAASIGVLETRVDVIVAFLQLEPNTLIFGVGTDPDWIIVDGDVPIVPLAGSGLNPPTVAADVITINSPGFYDITCQFGIDIITGNNTVIIQPQVNGLDTGLPAGVEFSGGQAAPINQPQARIAQKLAAGDLVTFVATELGTAAKLLLWSISGGTAVQTAFDFDALAGPSMPAPSGSGLPAGGVEGELIIKQSAAEGHAQWEPLILSGGGA